MARGGFTGGVRSSGTAPSHLRAAVSMHAPAGGGGSSSSAVRRESMEIAPGRAASEVATGLNAAQWKREVDKARSSTVNAVRVRHIVVQSAELAGTIQEQLRSGADFEKLARSISDCTVTREEGGEVGWVGLEDAFLDEIVPRVVREALIDAKPGDTVQTESDRGIHVSRVEDVFQTLNVQSKRRKKRLQGYGVSPQPLLDLLAKTRREQRVESPTSAFSQASQPMFSPTCHSRCVSPHVTAGVFPMCHTRCRFSPFDSPTAFLHLTPPPRRFSASDRPAQ